MIEKKLVRPELKRGAPHGFGWVDHRLVRERRTAGCANDSLALYLVLVTVADSEGLSYWSEMSLRRFLGLEVAEFRRARSELEAAGLVAYDPPIWQVLELSGGPGL